VAVFSRQARVRIARNVSGDMENHPFVVQRWNHYRAERAAGSNGKGAAALPGLPEGKKLL
jgi:hypothetical protein